MKRNTFETAKFNLKVGQYTITIERYDITAQVYDKEGNLIYRYSETLDRKVSIKSLCSSWAKSYPDAYRIQLFTAPALWCAIYDTRGRKIKQIYE